MDSWPERGRDISDWLIDGVTALRRLFESTGGQPAADSVLRHDELTLTPTREVAGAGPFSLLLMLGASNLMAGLATLLRHTDEILVARAHLPIVRSIQERELGIPCAPNESSEWDDPVDTCATAHRTRPEQQRSRPRQSRQVTASGRGSLPFVSSML